MSEKLNKFLYEAAVSITSSLDFELVLMELVHLFKDHIPTDGISLHVIEKKCKVMRTLARADQREAYRLESVVPLDQITYDSIVWDVKADVRIINDTKKDLMAVLLAGKTDLFENMDECSHIVIRFMIDEGRLGEVALQAHGKGRYTEEHVAMFKYLALPLSSALYNFLRHEELKQVTARQEENRFLARELRGDNDFRVIGMDTGLREVMENVRKVAPLDSTVLLLGETGVGKEVVATAIQRLSRRSEGPFIHVNCGSIPPELVDSELFGHEKGAFTGALNMRRGRFERAQGGTLFLDEIGELPLAAQTRLLRVLQERSIERVGGEKSIPVDIRVIAATNRDLNKMVALGDFREDLLYRLSVFPMRIPPLRDRKQDLPALVEHFVRREMQIFGFETLPEIDKAAWHRLMGYDWPGNVRELYNVVERELILCGNGSLKFAELDKSKPLESLPEQQASPVENPFFPSLDQVMIDHIKRALKQANGKVQGSGGAAELLGINHNTLRKRMRKHGFEFGRGKE